MELTKYLRISVFLSQTFGVISFKVKKLDGKIVFIESEKSLKIAKINFGFVVILHLALIVFSTDEINYSKDDLCVKIVRFVNLMAFTGGIIVMFFTITTKGKVICNGLNEISDLYLWSLSRIPNKKKSFNDGLLFLGIIANYLTTVFPLMLTALYVQRYKPPKVISYSYYAYSMWLENIFIYQFVTIARFVGEVYACVTQIPSRSCVSNIQLLRELLRSRSHEEIVKDFIEVLINAYKYALFFWICWSFTMILQFVLKVNLRMRVVIWCFFISIRVIAIIYACDAIKNESERIAENLQELFIETDDLRIKEEIEIYSFQLLHRKPNFNALGFYSLDFPLFHSMVASVATYIIILTQLKGSSD